MPANTISTHAPRTGSDGRRGIPPCPHQSISTHAPRTGSDVDGAVDVVHLAISTHAPRTGSDLI